ncbi:unnamed protein product [Clonostachys rhizophaga]|uniref:Heterokaryon incompatibility domain-containing protein n=1 Tax=Clonostachys rhizophaga TaxID=160324 RepID=A0A9N9YX73_9HYPO|nr:unnamed protein product [Clonostachys rhizophaga]
MLCTVCCDTLQWILSPHSIPHVKQVCTIEQFKHDSGFGNIYLPTQEQTPLVPVDRPLYMFSHHPTLESFEQSVRNGCSVCVGMNSLENLPDDNPMIAASGLYSLFKHQTIRLSPYRVSSRISLYSCNHSTSYRTTLNGWIGPLDNFNVNLSPSTGDETTFRLIEAWLNTCLGSHKECAKADAFVPPRLLQVDAGGNFRLVLKDNVKPWARYAILTHCYATDDGTTRLMQSTFERFLSSQPLSILPPSYRDAFTVLQRMGLQYLWIDRLCVLQDSRSDLAAHENARKDIHANSFLGIGAAWSSSPASGLFVERDPECVVANDNQFYTANDGTIIPLSAKSLVQRINFLNEPLSRSASALEARFLTPRMVHFGSKMVFWECYGAIADEVHPRARHINTGSGRESEIDLFGSDIKPLHGIQYTPSNNRTAQILSQWRAIVEQYTQCEVQQQDGGGRLLAHVASEIKRLLEQESVQEVTYLAGMWKNFFPAELLWHSIPNATRRVRDRAPSWSWLSLEAPIRYSTIHLEKANASLLCELINTPCNPDGTICNIVLSGKLAIAIVSPKTVLPVCAETETILETKALKNPDTGASIAEVQDWELIHQLHWLVHFDTKDDMDVGEVFMIPISTEPERRERWWHIRGLALRELDDGSFIRCGYCSLSSDNEEQARGLFKEVSDREITII